MTEEEILTIAPDANSLLRCELRALQLLGAARGCSKDDYAICARRLYRERNPDRNASLDRILRNLRDEAHNASRLPVALREFGWTVRVPYSENGKRLDGRIELVRTA